MCNRFMCNRFMCNRFMCNFFCKKKKKNNNKKKLPINIIPMTINPMIINPIYASSENTDLFSTPTTTPSINRERIIPNRKSKAEVNEEFFNHSKEALRGLDNYLFENSFDFGFE